MSRILRSLVAAVLALVWAGCSAAGEADSARSHAPRQSPPSESSAEAAPRPVEAPPAASREPRGRPTPLASDGRPRTSSLTISSIGIRGLRVVPYRGSPDDGPGTRIQNGGVAASPHGPGGGVGPGGVGNFIITAHRTSSTRAFAELPRLRAGDRVYVAAGRSRYTYRITGTRTTSFRSEPSLARQAAAVPGHPNRRPTKAMITLSTCATPEDHARGNYWSDEFGNPEHRIDKVGVMVAVRP